MATEPKPCPKCGKPVKNQGAHERFCPILKSKSSSADTLPNPPSKLLKEEKIKSTISTHDNLVLNDIKTKILSVDKNIKFMMVLDFCILFLLITVLYELN